MGSAQVGKNLMTDSARRYGIRHSISRAKKDTVLPLSQPVRGVNGTMMSEIPVAKGTVVLSNIPACNRNRAVWGEDALEWKPERWLQPLPRSVEEAHVPGIYANL